MAMTWTVEPLPGSRAIEVRTAGTFSLDDYVVMVDDITSRPFWRPSMDALFDHRQLDFGRAGFEEMWSASATHESRDDRIGRGRAAIVMKDLVDFGRGRMFESMTAERVSATIRIFTDEAEARAWLGLDPA